MAWNDILSPILLCLGWIFLPQNCSGPFLISFPVAGVHWLSSGAVLWPQDRMSRAAPPKLPLWLQAYQPSKPSLSDTALNSQSPGWMNVCLFFWCVMVARRVERVPCSRVEEYLSALHGKTRKASWLGKEGSLWEGLAGLFSHLRTAVLFCEHSKKSWLGSETSTSLGLIQRGGGRRYRLGSA